MTLREKILSVSSLSSPATLKAHLCSISVDGRNIYRGDIYENNLNDSPSKQIVLERTRETKENEVHLRKRNDLNLDRQQSDNGVEINLNPKQLVIEVENECL